MKQKKFFFEQPNNQKPKTKKLNKSHFQGFVNSQYFFMKISWVGPWVSRIDWCEGHWWGSMYVAVRLSDISSETGKKSIFGVLGCFWAYARQPHSHKSWDKPMPFASINFTNPRTNPWKFHEKILRIGGAGKWDFFEAAILNFLSRPFWILFFASYQWKTQPIYMRYHFFCTMDGFSRILEKKLSELLCTRLYIS